MQLRRDGLTLIESLISITLVSVLLLGIMGAFFISQFGTLRARHRITAHNIAKSYLEKEMLLGYGTDTVYNVTPGTAAPNQLVSPQTIDGIVYTVARDPAIPAVATDAGVYYKTVGFKVTWQERGMGGAQIAGCTEKVATHIAKRT